MYNNLKIENLTEDLQGRYQTIDEISVTKESSFLRMKDLKADKYVILKTYLEYDGGIINEKIINNEVKIMKRLMNNYILMPERIIFNKNDAFIFFSDIKYSLYHYIKNREISDSIIWSFFRDLIIAVDYCK
jgi:hypothetical protein